MSRRTLVGAAVTTLALLAGCASHETTPAEPPSRAAPAAAGTAVGEDVPARIRWTADAVARAGVRTVVVSHAEAPREITAFGRVLDPLPLIELRLARTAARAAVVVARAESERVTRLHRDDQNASTRELEAARAALDKATADLGALAARLALGWGAAAEVSDDVGDGLAAGRLALLRVDLPAGVELAAPPATVTVLGAGEPRVARIVGRAPTTDPLAQGDAWLALLDADPPRPGAIVAVTVPAAPAPVAGVAVPAAALVWVEARPALFTETAPGAFERRAVTLGPRLDDERWILTAGVAADERVVVAGAAVLLSSELTSHEPSED